MEKKKNNKTVLIIVALVIVIGFILYMSISKPSTSQPAESNTNQQTNIQMTTLPDGLQIGDSVVGTGKEAVSGTKVTVHYTGTLLDGTKFDSSLDRGQPFTFNLGAGEVIRGWDEGVQGMKVGGKRKLIIPSELGYGARGAGSLIPPNTTLVFEVELLGVN